MSIALRSPIAVARRAFDNASAHDFVACAFHVYLLARCYFAPTGPDATLALRVSFTLFASAMTVFFITRGEVLPRGPFRGLLYRLGLFAPLFLSYFELKSLLPGLRPVLLDTPLYEIDTSIFGQTPSVYLDQFVNFASVEWFAFFYYSHFTIMASYLVGTLFFDEGKRMSELVLGAALVVTVGHSVYTIVPGFGPHIAVAFQNELHGGFWWRTVDSAVAAGGAQLDIFPSLHTALPTVFLLHALRYRDTAPFKYVWPITAFFLFNILIATLILRWHWGLDLLAGLTLSIVAQRIAIEVVAHQQKENRAEDGRQELWEPIRLEAPDTEPTAGR